MSLYNDGNTITFSTNPYSSKGLEAQPHELIHRGLAPSLQAIHCFDVFAGVLISNQDVGDCSWFLSSLRYVFVGQTVSGGHEDASSDA
jgi:hypothetical protein